MSLLNGCWQLGCCVFQGNFQEYDRFTSLGGAVSAYASSLTLNSTVSTNYAASPMFLKGKIFKNQAGTADYAIYGPEIILGPSSNSTYSGSVEAVQPYTISSNTISVLSKSINQSHTAYPSSAYTNGDPVIIRTVPLGWNPGGTFQDYYYAVCPVGRYEERQSNYILSSNPGTNLPLMTDYKKADLGVRMICNHDSTYVSGSDQGFKEGQYIAKSSEVNSFSARIRCYRVSWYYRLVRATVNDGLSIADSAAAIDFKLQDASGATINVGDIGVGQGEEGHSWDHGPATVPTATGRMMYRVNYSGPTIDTGEWVYDAKILSPYNVNDPDWYWISSANSTIASAGINPSNQAMNRGNRWGVELHLGRGINTAFDVDDLIIEHAQGTSQEANGYYEIDDWPISGSVNWDVREGFSKNVLMNGSVRSVRTNTQTTPKYTISADYENVEASIYQDLVALANWQRRGYAICLRPFGYDSLPPVLVGFLSLSKPSSKSWSLDRVSFSMGFEES